MNVRQLREALSRYPSDAEVRIVTSSNGRNLDGAVGIYCVSREVIPGNAPIGVSIDGPLIEPRFYLTGIE